MMDGEVSGDTRAWRKLLGYLRPHRGVLVGATVLGFVGGLAGLAQPLAARAVIDALGVDGPLLTPVLALLGLVVLGAVIASVSAYLLGRTAESVVRSARKGLAGRLLRLCLTEVDRMSPGDLVSRLTSDSSLLQNASRSGVVDAVTAVFLIVGAIVFMALMDVVLLGVTLGVVALIFVVSAVLLPKIGKATERAQEAVGEMGAAAERALGAFRTVKASGAEEREVARIGVAADRAWHRGVEAARWNAVLDVSAGLTAQIAFLAVLGVGGARVASGAMGLSSLIAFLLYLFYLIGPIAQLVSALTHWQAGLAAVRRIHAIERLAIEPLDGLVGSPSVRGPAAVAFADVIFGYGDGSPIHSGVTFALPPGGVTAVIGPSGTGKTTLFSLLERFYEPGSGRIEVDGVEVRDWPLSALRATIGYVEQDAPVLAGTLGENLRYANPDASDAEVAEVLRRARLDDFVANLPDGLDTKVGHRGMTLSGGERQRVAIARALLRRPRILLLDEVTSQLDALNEQALRDSVTEAGRTSTVLVIAHRLSTVMDADRILLLDGGRVRAAGTHAELLEVDGLYQRLATTQALA